MREPFREQARRNMELYREFCGEISDDTIENAMSILWLQSVTDGNGSYQAYLISPLWHAISRDVLLRDGHLCAVCRREAEAVHHRCYDYEVMAGLDDSKLISLCDPCHHYIHFEKMRKTKPVEWDRRLQACRKRIPAELWPSLKDYLINLFL